MLYRRGQGVKFKLMGTKDAKTVVQVVKDVQIVQAVEQSEDRFE